MFPMPGGFKYVVKKKPQTTNKQQNQGQKSSPTKYIKL